MSEDEYIKELKKIIKEHSYDPEVFHSRFDDLLRTIIEDELKFKRFFKVFDNTDIPMWSA